VGGIGDGSCGGVVPGAVVIVRATSVERQVVTGPDGRFTIDAPDGGDITVVVRAGGFAESSKRLGAAELASDLNLVVSPATVLETVTVTPARGVPRAAHA